MWIFLSVKFATSLLALLAGGLTKRKVLKYFILDGMENKIAVDRKRIRKRTCLLLCCLTVRFLVSGAGTGTSEFL